MIDSQTLREVAGHPGASKETLIMFLLKAADEIDRLKNGRWISVKERLPDIPDGKDRVKCIVATQNGRVTSMWLVRVGRNVQWEDCYGSVKPWFVTHWQPLPEPPKGE